MGITDAVKILYRRYIGNDLGRLAQLQTEKDRHEEMMKIAHRIADENRDLLKRLANS